jgi:hypothetical protein
LQSFRPDPNFANFLTPISLRLNEIGVLKMSTALKMEVNPQEIIEAVRKMKQHDREEFLENLLAATCPEYLASIREGRAEYKAGQTKSHKDVFGQ